MPKTGNPRGRPPGCKICRSEYKDFIDESLASGVELQEILNTAGVNGFVVAMSTLVSHREHSNLPDPLSEDLERVVEELKEEARQAPPVIAGAYLVAIRQLQTIKNHRPSADTAIKALEAITRITGMRTQQQLLLAYAERAFTRGEVSTTKARQLLPPQEDLDAEVVEPERVALER